MKKKSIISESGKKLTKDLIRLQGYRLGRSKARNGALYLPSYKCVKPKKIMFNRIKEKRKKREGEREKLTHHRLNLPATKPIPFYEQTKQCSISRLSNSSPNPSA